MLTKLDFILGYGNLIFDISAFDFKYIDMYMDNTCRVIVDFRISVRFLLII